MPDHASHSTHPSSPRLVESAARVAAMREAAASDPEGFWKQEALSRIALGP